jgi:hypothetical protein
LISASPAGQIEVTVGFEIGIDIELESTPIPTSGGES